MFVCELCSSVLYYDSHHGIATGQTLLVFAFTTTPTVASVKVKWSYYNKDWKWKLQTVIPCRVVASGHGYSLADFISRKILVNSG